MATSSSWSKLPGDILSLIAHRLDSAVDRLRLRATCPAWRSSIPLPKLSPLPLTLPFYKATTIELNPYGRHGSLRLFQSTIYRLDSLAGDESNDNRLMVKVIETGAKKNCFSLLLPLKIGVRVRDDGNGSFPRGINLLDYRAVEVCNSYSLKFLVDRDDESILKFYNRRVVVLGDWDAEIVVFLLREWCGSLQAWRKGDAEWTMIGGEGKYDDVLCWNGKCYAVNVAGEVVVFDEDLRPVKRIEYSMVYDSLIQRKYLVLWKGELYMVKKTSDTGYIWKKTWKMTKTKVRYIWKKTKVVFLKLNQRGDYWEHVDGLSEGAFFLTNDVSFGFRAKDFSRCKENDVCLMENYWDDDEGSAYGDDVVMYDPDGNKIVDAKDFGGFKENDVCLMENYWDDGEGSAYGDDVVMYDPDGNKIVALAKFPEYARMFWPPPSWLRQIFVVLH